MSAWAMIEACMRQQPARPVPPAYGPDRPRFHEHPDDGRPTVLVDGGEDLTLPAPNLLVWTGTRHLLAFELREDGCTGWIVPGTLREDG